MVLNEHRAASAPLQEEVPAQVLAEVQQQLASILGAQFTTTLAGSGGRNGATHYHLSVEHSGSGLSLETRGSVERPFIEDLFALAWRMRGMLESPELERMDAPGPVRRLTWISELACPNELSQIAASLYPTSRVLLPQG